MLETQFPFSKKPGYITPNFVRLSMLEVPVAGLRLKRTFSQKKLINEMDALKWLGLYFENVDKPPIVARRLSAGFYFTVFVFSRFDREWVIKVGAKQAPLLGYPNPSSPEYSRWYLENLDLQLGFYNPFLPNLIPQPQNITHFEDSHKKTATTLIFQPFYDHVISAKELKLLSPKNKQKLVDELKVFKNITSDLYRNFGLLPDLSGSNNNLVIAEENNKYNLVLIDNGLCDNKQPSPLINGFNYLMFNIRTSLLRFQLGS